MYLQIKQLRIDVPAGTIQPTHQLLVRDAHSAAESVLLSSACTAVYGVMSHVHISNTPSTTNIIVELYGLLQASKCCICVAMAQVNTLRDTAVPAEGNGDYQTLICVLVARPRRCLTLSNPVPWQN